MLLPCRAFLIAFKVEKYWVINVSQFFYTPKSEKSLENGLDISLDQTKQNGKNRILKNVEVMIFYYHLSRPFVLHLAGGY